jgi:molybdopterin/thiamine biosynthesis adenylyltransferase
VNTELSQEHFAHQEGIFDPKHARKVVLIGAGSVGSHVAYHLTKMGVTDLEVWDADSVATHNTPMSLYGPGDIGRFKVDALAEIIERLTGTRITIKRQKYTGEAFRNVSVVACVDHMDERRLIWERVKLCPTVDIFCDTRTAVAYIDVLSIAPCDPEDIDRYEALLFPQSKAAKQSCGYHGIVYAASRAAQIVAANLALFWTEGRKEWRIAEQCQTLDVIIGPKKERA